MRKILLLAFLVVCGVSFSVVSVSTCTNISSNVDPQYQLTANLVGANQATFGGTACIAIGVSDITLDCNGFSITDNGTGPGAGIGIFSGNGISNITVQNCPGISNYTYGTYISFTTSSLFTNLTAFDNGNGLFIGTSADGNVVSDNTVYNNSIAGISVGSADNNTFTNNTAIDNNIAGFDFQSNTGNTLTDNAAFSNNGSGFAFIVSSGNILSGNNATGNGNDGFALTFSHSNSLTGNTASGNSDRGFELGNSTNNLLDGNTVDGGNSGIFLFSNSANNLISGNSVSGSTGNAIFTGDGNAFTGNVVTSSFQGIGVGANNVLSGNTVSGIAAFGGFRLESFSHNNVLTDNTVFNSNRGLEIHHANNTTVTNLHLYNNSMDFLTTTSTGDITESLSGIVFDSEAGGFINYTNLSISDILENNSAYSIDHAPSPGSTPTVGHVSFENKFVSIANSTPGVSIDSITWHYLDSELGPYDETLFGLWKHNGAVWTGLPGTLDTGANTLALSDLDSFSTFAIFQSPPAGPCPAPITSPGSYSLNSSVVGAPNSALSGNACVLIASSNVFFDCNGMSITNNGTGGTTYGVVLNGSLSGVTVANCQPISGYSYGIYVHQSDGNSILDNTAQNNSAAGITLSSSDGNTVDGNTATGPGSNAIEILNSSDNTLSGNSVSGQTFEGFYVSNSGGNTFTNNDAAGGFDGFLLINSSGNTLSGNSATSPTFEGFSMLSGSIGNTLTGNDAVGGFDGFLVLDSNSNILSANNASGHTFNGFTLISSVGTSLSSNLAFSNNFDGFGLIGSNGTTLTGNTAFNNAQNGINLIDSNSTTITNSHLYSNNPDFRVSGTNITVTVSGLVLDDPAGNFTGYTNLSFNDLVASSYRIDHAVDPGSTPSAAHISFANKFVNITNISGNVSINSITWRWQDSEVAAGNYTEFKFELWKFDGTNWTKQTAALNTVTNTLSISNLNNFSIFAIMQNDNATLPSGGGSGDGDGGSDGGSPDLSMGFDPEGNQITVTSQGNPIPGATVRVNGSIIGTTNSEGMISFPGCSGTAYLSATKAGYSPAELNVNLNACQQCAADADCPASYQCSSGTCIPVSCSCGTVSNHQCVPYSCCSDSDCASGLVCQDHSCVEPQPQCETDSDCAATMYCELSSGSCKEVTGACGQVTDHKFVPYGYECGSEPGCPSCAGGSECVGHKCVSFQITCPSQALLGEKTSCSSNCPNCEVEVQGKKYMTDGSGKVEITFENQGTVPVRLLRGGAQAQVTVRPSGAPEPGAPQTGAGDGGSVLLLVGLLVLLIIVGVVYWRSRSGKK